MERRLLQRTRGLFAGDAPLREHFPQLNDWQVEILGTDISVDVVNRAQAGRYQQGEVNRGLPARYRQRYLRQVGDEWEVFPEDQEDVPVRSGNLCNEACPLKDTDGILLRNVMLYFSTETRRQLLLDMHRMLHPDGFLIWIEQQPDLPDQFRAELKANACYYRPLPNG